MPNKQVVLKQCCSQSRRLLAATKASCIENLPLNPCRFSSYALRGSSPVVARLARYFGFPLLDQKQGLHHHQSAADAYTIPLNYS
jgi:hypothetical protein